MNSVESETHFLLYCHKYEIIRQQFLSPFFAQPVTDDLLQVKSILNPDSAQKCKSVTNFIQMAFDSRKTGIQNLSTCT